MWLVELEKINHKGLKERSFDIFFFEKFKTNNPRVLLKLHLENIRLNFDELIKFYFMR